MQTNPIDGDRRPDLFDLRRIHKIQPGELELATGIPESTILEMLRNAPVSRQDAIKILNKISIVTGERYTLENVRVKLVEDWQDVSNENLAQR